MVPVHTSVGLASLRHTPLATAFARLSAKIGNSSQSSPHDPPGCSTETSMPHINGVLAPGLRGAAFRSHASPAPSTMARCSAHLTEYLISARGQRPVSTRFHFSGDERTVSAYLTSATSKTPTASFVVGTGGGNADRESCA